jgi:hypothetical protein
LFEVTEPHGQFVESFKDRESLFHGEVLLTQVLLFKSSDFVGVLDHLEAIVAASRYKETP